MRVEFLNFNDDPRLDPEIQTVESSRDEKNQPPSFCLPWVEATRYSIQLKANFEYWIRKSGKKIEACAVEGGEVLPVQEIYAAMPAGAFYMPKDEIEKKEGKVSVGHTPAFSSPWQHKTGHSVTLKLGVCWWTPPGWGLFFGSAVHRNEGFRVVEGYVRTDLWHRDVPIIIQPLEKEIRIPKYSVIASAFPVLSEDIQLQKAEDSDKKLVELGQQISFKRLNPSFYKILVREQGKKRKD